MTLQYDFENFIRHELPYKLNVSNSKQVALDIKFYHFSDNVRQLEMKAPNEFELFFNEFRTKFDEIERWSAPRGTKIFPIIIENNNGVNQYQKYPNGKIQYHLVDK